MDQLSSSEDERPTSACIVNQKSNLDVRKPTELSNMQNCIRREHTTQLRMCVSPCCFLMVDQGARTVKNLCSVSMRVNCIACCLVQHGQQQQVCPAPSTTSDKQRASMLACHAGMAMSPRYTQRHSMAATFPNLQLSCPCSHGVDSYGRSSITWTSLQPLGPQDLLVACGYAWVTLVPQ